MSYRKLVAVFVVVAGLVLGVAPTVDAIIRTFGDSSFGFGTPLDENGDQTVCSDGFELIAVSTPNGGPFNIGDPTGNIDGSVMTSPVVGVFDASLLTDHPDFNLLSSFSTPTGFDLLDSDGNPAAPNYGFTSVDMVLSDTYFELPPSDPPVTKAADGIGSTMFMPSSPLPVGQDVVIITGSYPGFGSNRRVTVVDCAPVPIDVQVEIKNNKVKPQKPHQKLKVFIINDGTFNIGEVEDILVGGASPFRERMRDYDHDGDFDLKLKVRTGDTSVECGDTSVTVTGMVEGQPFSTDVPIQTKCKKPKH